MKERRDKEIMKLFEEVKDGNGKEEKINVMRDEGKQT